MYEEELMTLEELESTLEGLGEPDAYDLLHVWVGCGRALVRQRFQERASVYAPELYEEEEARACAAQIWEVWVLAREELLEAEEREEPAEISQTPLLLTRGSFWVGVYARAGVLGAAALVLAWRVGGGDLAWAVVAGMIVMGANLGAIFAVVRWMLPKGREPRGGLGGWAGLFLLKLLVLFWLTYYVVLVLGMSAVGFLGGYIVLMTALTWNVVSVSVPGRLESSDGGGREW